VFSYSFDPGPEGAHTGSCIDCARFDELSPAAERAIRHAFPTGRVVSADSVLSSDTYRVLTRTARVLVGRNVVSIDVSVATGPAETSYTVGADRVTVSARVDGFRVVLRSIGPDVALPVLKSLAEDPRLVVA
jgi:hypothetical protein